MLRFSIYLIVLLGFFADHVNAQQTDVYEDDLFYRIEFSLEQDSMLSYINDLGVSVDHVHAHKDEKGKPQVITELSGYDLNILKDEDISFKVLIEDMSSHYEQQYFKDLETFDLSEVKNTFDTPENFELGSMGGHKTYDEVVSDLDLMHLMFPDLISEKISIGKSIENRDIWMVWVGTELDENKPQALYTSLTHAREPNGMMANIYFMWWLLENYGEDETATFIMENRHLAFVPVVNPDGYEYNRSTNPNGGGMHRKNRRPVGSWRQGIDLNRNFGPFDFWDHSNGGSSTDPNSDIYRGSAPFSEPETDALRTIVIDNDFRTAFNYHTYSNLLVYPYGALNRVTIDNHIFQGYAIEMTEFNGYVYGTDEETVGYNTRGNSDDYMYGYEAGNPRGRKKIIAYTPEVGNWSDGFWPSSSRIIPLSDENVHPNILLALYAGPELRYEEQMQPVASLETLDVGTQNYITFEFDELYNYGRYEIEDAELVISTNYEGAVMIVDRVPLPEILEDETFTGITESFVIEFEADVETGQQLNLTLELTGSWMRQNPVWEYSMMTDGTPTNIDDGLESPSSFILYPNYPNPFNPTTQIRFSLKENEMVRLGVYDSMGRKVQTLVNETMSRGEHRITFDGAGLSSGMYFYRLEAGNLVQTRKMTLLK